MLKPLFWIIWITVIVVFAFFTRWWVDDKHRSPQHLGQFIIRAVLAFANTFIFYEFRPESMLEGYNDQNLWEVLLALRHWFMLLVVQGVLFWDFFDPLLNYLRDKSYNYVSKSNLFDKFFHRYKNPFKAQVIAKVISTIVAFTLWLTI